MTPNDNAPWTMTARPLLLGHRGARASRSVPENTLGSFDLALEHGCDGFEFDVRLSRGPAVVCHDAKVGGITISQATPDQLPGLPRLQEVLQRYQGRAFLDIELKEPGLESEVLVTLSDHLPERGYVVSSFLPVVLEELRSRSASVPLGFICERKGELPQWRGLPVEYVIPYEAIVSKDLVKEIHSAGKTIIVWTVNNDASMLRLVEWGVDAIISDDTQLLVRTVRSRSAPDQI